MSSSRDSKIDILRVIGSVLIILAHVNPPQFLFDLRSFDVVLLCFISGMSFYLSWKPYTIKKDYFIKRIKKLIVPAYILLITWFCLGNIVTCLLNKPAMFSIEALVSGLLLFNDGMGYVWIVKIYIIFALVGPYMHTAINKQPKLTIVMLIGVYLSLYVTYTEFFTGLQKGLIESFVEEYIIGGVGYLIPFSIGMLTKKQGSKPRFTIVMGVVSLVIMAGFQLLDIVHGFSPSEYKYPPSIYYISYGLLVCALLYLVIPNIRNQQIEWISKNSYMIYILHVPFIIATIYVKNWILRFLIVITGTLFSTWISPKVNSFVKARYNMLKKN